MSYQDQITAKIRTAVNDHIEKLKLEHPELLITKQWKVMFDDGFVPGHVSLPVVTGSKYGKYLVADVEFIVPENLEIDLDAIELTLRDEPYQNKKRVVTSPAIDEPLGLINDIIVGVNNFLSEMNLTNSRPMVQKLNIGSSPHINPLKVNSILPSSHEIGEVRDRIRSSGILPDWLKSVSNRDVYDQLIDKIAEGYTEYSKTKDVSLSSFIKLYEDYLKREGKLNDYCKYKAQPITLDEKGHCIEAYCSKKPYNRACEHSVLQFGKK